MKINLELTVEEINQILATLNQMPYGQVAAQVAHLIAKIKEQGEPQVTQEISEP